MYLLSQMETCMSKGTVLLVDSYKPRNVANRACLETMGVVVHDATSTQAVMALLPNAKEFDAIMWYGKLSDGLTTDGPIQAYRDAGYTGKMIAASGHEFIRKKQLRVGCQHNPGEEEPLQFLIHLMSWE